MPSIRRRRARRKRRGRSASEKPDPSSMPRDETEHVRAQGRARAKAGRERAQDSEMRDARIFDQLDLVSRFLEALRHAARVAADRAIGGNSRRMAKRLKEAGNEVELIEYPGVTHLGILRALAPGFRTRTPLRADMLRFIARH